MQSHEFSRRDFVTAALRGPLQLFYMCGMCLFRGKEKVAHKGLSFSLQQSAYLVFANYLLVLAII